MASNLIGRLTLDAVHFRPLPLNPSHLKPDEPVPTELKPDVQARLPLVWPKLSRSAGNHNQLVYLYDGAAAGSGGSAGASFNLAHAPLDTNARSY